MNKVLFVGSNPSVVSKTYNPFCESTVSGRILVGWIRQTCPDDISAACNVTDLPTQSNRPLTVKEIKNSLPRLQLKINSANPTKIVALGKTAAKALTLLRIPHYAMPHPSPVNRQLNNQQFIDSKMNGLIQYLQT